MKRRRDRPFVELSLKAINELMTVSSVHITLFVNVYLQNLTKLLENPDFIEDKQLLLSAVESFEHFCTIREDIVNLSRSYDSFIKCFSDLANSGLSFHTSLTSNQKDFEYERQCGLRGLASIIRKLSNDDQPLSSSLFATLPSLIPPFLSNMRNNDTGSSLLSEKVICDILGRVNGHAQLASFLAPVFNYLDLHRLWCNDEICRKYLDVIKNNTLHETVSVALVTYLIGHIEQFLNDKEVRMDILRACKYSMSFYKSDCLGTHVYTCLRQLCTYLKSLQDDDPQFEQDILSTIMCLVLSPVGQQLPPVPHKSCHSSQTVESLVFLLNETSQKQMGEHPRLQLLLTNVILQIMTNSVLDQDSMVPLLNFFEPLMELLKSDLPDVRLASLQIMIVMFDRNQDGLSHNYQPQQNQQWETDFTTMTTTAANLDEQIGRLKQQTQTPLLRKSISVRISDAEFINTCGDNLIESLQSHLLGSHLDQTWFNVILILCVLFYRQFIHESTSINRLLSLCFNVQDAACSQQRLTKSGISYLHGFVAALLDAICSISRMKPNPDCTRDHIEKVIDGRKKFAPDLLSLEVVPRHSNVAKQLPRIDSQANDSTQQGRILDSLLFDRSYVQISPSAAGSKGKIPSIRESFVDRNGIRHPIHDPTMIGNDADCGKERLTVCKRKSLSFISPKSMDHPDGTIPDSGSGKTEGFDRITNKTKVQVPSVDQLRMVIYGSDLYHSRRDETNTSPIIRQRNNTYFAHRKCDFEDEYILTKWRNATDYFECFAELNDEYLRRRQTTLPTQSTSNYHTEPGFELPLMDNLLCTKRIIDLLSTSTDSKSPGRLNQSDPSDSFTVSNTEIKVDSSKPEQLFRTYAF